VVRARVVHKKIARVVENVAVVMRVASARIAKKTANKCIELHPTKQRQLQKSSILQQMFGALCTRSAPLRARHVQYHL
jgi:hypothetical protein